ncbi:MAG: hypothetical protein ABR981_03680 [Candidatus Micrarchaeaceae archaeon]|jgi:predicted transcriptional regulator of viral defense system
MKYISYLRQRFNKYDFPVFRVSDVKIEFSDKKISSSYIHLMLYNLNKKGEIRRVTKSAYTFHNDVSVVGFAFEPFYYGFESALSIMGFSDQGTNLTVVTPRNVRAGIRAFEGRNYRIKRIKKEHFFGYKSIKYGNFWIPVSDLEKTLIDMISLNDHIKDEVKASILKNINRKILNKYLENYDIKLKGKVIEWIKK